MNTNDSVTYSRRWQRSSHSCTDLRLTMASFWMQLAIAPKYLCIHGKSYQKCTSLCISDKTHSFLWYGWTLDAVLLHLGLLSQAVCPISDTVACSGSILHQVKYTRTKQAVETIANDAPANERMEAKFRSINVRSFWMSNLSPYSHNLRIKDGWSLVHRRECKLKTYDSVAEVRMNWQ